MRAKSFIFGDKTTKHQKKGKPVARLKTIRFTIGAKLAASFGLLLLVVLGSSYMTYMTLQRNIEANERISDVHTPSVSRLHDLRFLVNDSKMLIKNWVFIEKKAETPDKQRLENLHGADYPALVNNLAPLASQWNDAQQAKYNLVLAQIDSLFALHADMMARLSTFENYEDAMTVMVAQSMVEDGGPASQLTQAVNQELDELIQEMERVVLEANLSIKGSFARFQRLVLASALVLMLFILTVSTTMALSIVRPIGYLKRVIVSMGGGMLPDHELRAGNDEIGQMAMALNELVSGLRKTSQFSLQIGQGDFETEFRPLSQEDVLGNSLMIMRQNLRKAAREEAKRKEEDFQRNWTSQGIAKFGELLRQGGDDLRQLSFAIVRETVRYLDCNQGGLFIVEDAEPDDVHLQLAAAFAYNRKKLMEKRVNLGEGLVGRCIQEKETIYMTEIPNDYIRITSGMGDDNPRALLLVPLVFNEQTFGVIELASFSPFPRYRIDFVEKIAESIASTIQSAKININTAKLLSESQEKSRKLAEQEEEVRQTMEQMQAQTQMRDLKHREAMQQTKDEFEERIAAINRTHRDEIISLQAEIRRLKQSKILDS